MTNRKFSLTALVLAASLSAGGGALVATGALAQATNPPAAAPGQGQPQQPRPMRPSRIEGRIAYLKAELKVTSAQEPAFDKVAQVMRQDDQERRQAFEQMRGNAQDRQSETALQRLETRARVSAMRAQETDRFLAAFRPLYDSLSPEQKKSADDMLSHGGHRGHFGHRR